MTGELNGRLPVLGGLIGEEAHFQSRQRGCFKSKLRRFILFAVFVFPYHLIGVLGVRHESIGDELVLAAQIIAVMTVNVVRRA
jgi:hypothetical protein